MDTTRRAGGKYPAFEGVRLPLMEAASRGGGPVACRWFRTFVTDESGRLPVLSTQGEMPCTGDLVAGRLVAEGLGWVLVGCEVYSENRLNGLLPDRGVFERGDILRKRSALMRHVRDFFDAESFLEVETPYLVKCPAVEPHLEALAAGDGYLATSPELHMKRFLVSGFEKVYQIARVFRADEAGRFHLREFSLLEWYRAWSGPSVLMDDCERLVQGLCRKFGHWEPSRPFARVEYRDVFFDRTGLDPFAWQRDAGYLVRLRNFAEAEGLVVGADSEGADLVEGIFAHVVERSLISMGAVFVVGFPSWAAVLARVAERQGFHVAERFELYMDGLEIANAYHELTDPDVHLERLRESGQKREASGKLPYPLDSDFFLALQAGMPPSSGIALGLDRLLMWLLGIGDIRDAVAYT